MFLPFLSIYYPVKRLQDTSITSGDIEDTTIMQSEWLRVMKKM